MIAARLGALGLLVAAGCAPESAGARSEPIVGGALDSGDPAVVALVSRRTRCDQVPETLCTGTLISERVVLTAAHCLDVFGEDGAYEVVFGSDVSAPDAAYVVVAEARKHPSYDEDTHAFDVAVLRLLDAAPATPATLATAPAVTESDLSTAVRAVGFGRTESAPMPDGMKRDGTMEVSAVDPLSFTTVPGPALTCVGDSGGPVFVARGSEELLAGVTASGDFGCRENAVNVRVDAVSDFIDPFVAASETAPLGRPAGTIAPEALCEGTCASDDDCPDGLECMIALGVDGRCVLRGLGMGRFGEECTGDAECAGPGGSCARRWPSGPSACACFGPCVVMGAPDAGPEHPGDGGGCACNAGPGGGSGPALVLVATLLVALRRRWT